MSAFECFMVAGLLELAWAANERAYVEFAEWTPVFVYCGVLKLAAIGLLVAGFGKLVLP